MGEPEPAPESPSGSPKKSEPAGQAELRKTIKALQKERDIQHAQDSSAGDPPQFMVDMYTDGPISMLTFRERFGGA